MEQKIISLLKFNPPLGLTNSTTAALSYRLDHLCVTSPKGHLFVYSLSTQEEECYHLVWESPGPTYSFRFSDDGKYLLVVLQTRSVQIYSLNNSKVNLLVEIDPLQLNSLLECITADMKTANMKIVSFTSNQLILLVERKWMVSVLLKLAEQLEPLTIKVVAHLSSLVALRKCKQHAYCLTAGGSLLAYSLESGKQVASVNLHSLKHGSADGKALDIFTDLTISEEGSLVAVSDVTGKVYFAKLEDLFCSYNSEEGRYKDDDASSTISVSSGTSFTSISTAASQRRLPSSSAGDSISVYTMDISEHKRPSRVSLWHSYLASIKSPSAELDPVRRHSKVNSADVMRILDTSSIPENLSFRSLHIMAAGVVLWYAEKYSWRGGLYQLYNITTGKLTAEFSVPKDTLVIPGGYLGIMDAFLSSDSLWLFLGHLSKELVITKLLNCMDTKSIHRLQHAGEWKDLMVPLPALTEGLKNQHMDVAKLALTLHSEAFRSSFCKTAAETHIIWQTRVQSLSLQMEELFGAAHETLKKSRQMSSFMEQLILLYLQHANDLIQFLCEVESRDALIEKRINLMMKQIMMHVAQLRGYLRRASGETPLTADLYKPLENLDEHSKAQWNLWQNMEDEEIILDAASKDKIPLMEMFLHKCRGWKAENILHRIRKYASITLKDLLRSGEIKKAEKLLMSLGTDPHAELKGICLQTSDCNLRDKLAKYLSQNGLLAAVELEAWNFIRLIENIIQTAPVSKGKCSVKDIPPYLRIIPTLDIPDRCRNYSHLSLNSILRQSLDWRTTVLVELYLNTSEAELEKFIEAKSVWQYLLHINKEDALLCWISSFYSKYEDRSDHATCTAISLTHWDNKSPLLLKPEIQRIFSAWEITQNMIDVIHGADSMKTTKEKLLDYLSRNGVFSVTEQQNPSMILARLCRTKNLMYLKNILNQPSANVSYFLFQELFIKCCIQLEFHNIFFSCLQNLDLSEERMEHILESLPTKDKQKHKWFRFFLKMKDLNGNWSDELLIYQAINGMVSCISNEEINIYLVNHPLVVLALTLYAKKQISKVLKTEELGEFVVDTEILHAAFEQLPVLKMALTYQKHGLSQQPSVSVYHLLQDSSPFNVAKVFSWQEGNRCKAGEYPHFSSEKLVSKYGHMEILTFLYYLKQEQPSFAVNMFVIDQLKTHKRISKRARKHACNLAHGLALKEFTKENIVCSCISFIEMLGADSGSVKIHVAVANKILNHLASSGSENIEKNGSHQAKISCLLHGLVQKDVNVAYEILNLLETTLLHSISTRRDSTLVENVLHWNIAVKFAKLHDICLPELFLRECANTNDWLTFILFIYMHQYPLQQAMQLIKEFNSNKLQEHLSYAVAHTKEERIKKVKETSRDTRNLLYSRLQLLKGGTKSDSLPESPTTDVGTAILTSSSSEEEFYRSRKIGVDVETAMFHINGDIFHTLLTCHRSQDPPQALLTACHMLHNPLLAVFATCYEPSSLLACFCSWLITSLTSYGDDDQMLSFRSALEEQIWSAEQLEQLLQQTVTDQCVSVLSRGFQLFFPNNPLCSFSIFLNECVQKKNFKESAIFMKAFKAGYVNIKNYVVAVNYDMDGAFLNSAQWIASVVVNLACLALAKCFSSSFHQLQFLGILCDTSFADFLTVQSVDFQLLHQLGECLSGTGIIPEWSSLCCIGEKCNQELMRCVDKLIEARRYQQALDFAVLAGLSKENIIIAQWSDLFQEDASKLKYKQKDETDYFWYMCNTAFVEANVHPKTAVKFFRDHSEKVCDFIERFHVLRLALNWLRSCNNLSIQNVNSDSNEKLILEKTEMEMWKCLLISKAELEHVPTEVIVSDKPRLVQCLKDELLASSGSLSLTLHETVNDEEQLNCLNLLIERLLDEGDIYTACRLESIFNHSSQDLQLLLTCMDLAEGEISHHQLTGQQKTLLMDANSTPSGLFKRRALKSLKHTPLNSSRVSTQSESLDQSVSSDICETSVLEKQDMLLILERLLERVQHGKQIGNRIICCYRAALSLDRTYQEIITLEDPVSLLKFITTEPHTIMVASDLISAAQTNSEQIAALLCEEVVAAVSRGHIQDGAFEGVTIWGSDAEQNFHLFIELCDDPSILGTKLLNVATHIGATQPDAIKEVVEILVRAHDCYTAACNMEGIAAVLQLAQTLTESLLLRQEWALMVRLLTGIGRYTEMNYIFQILKNNEQFEFLLGKGLDKKSNLKLAVLDFLKQYCPEDRELFRLVALHFTMYGEVAILWENEGQEVMNVLLNHSRFKQPIAPTLLANTEDTKKLLNTIMVNFTHAAEYFIQAKKLNRAMAAAHHAELVALQISQINSVPPGQETDCLLQLGATEVDNLIVNKLSFPQACLIARAYCHPVDWGAALYQQCIVQAKTAYLSEFMYSMTLTTALVEDVARRFQRETEVTMEMAAQMKKFVLAVLNVEVKYRIASQLGFRDVIENLLTGPELPYLKDTVWRSGFTSRHYPS